MHQAPALDFTRIISWSPQMTPRVHTVAPTTCWGKLRQKRWGCQAGKQPVPAF